IAASGMSVSIAIFGFGVVLAAYALQTSGARALALHAASIALYVASILLFEVTVGLVAIVVLGYLRIAPRKTALARWGADLVASGATVLIFTIGQSTSYARLGIGDTITNAWSYAGDSLTLIGRSVIPIADAGHVAGIVVVAALVCVVVIAV